MNRQEEKNLESRTTKQRVVVGAIVEIPIDTEYYVYAQILKNRGYAFFDYRSKQPLHNISILINKPVLFIVSIYDYVVKNNIWHIVGKLPIREDLKVQPMMYIYDADSDKFNLYNNNTGEIAPCTKDKAFGLERASVWAENHIVDRIRDYYNNVPCIWLKEHYKLFPEQEIIH